MKVPLAIILINKIALVPAESPPTRGEVLRVSNNFHCVSSVGSLLALCLTSKLFVLVALSKSGVAKITPSCLFFADLVFNIQEGVLRFDAVLFFSY